MSENYLDFITESYINSVNILVYPILGLLSITYNVASWMLAFICF